MIELKKSGLPIFLDEKKNLLDLHPPLKFDEFIEKKAGQMLGLFADGQALDLSENVYNVYRRIRFPDDENLLSEYDYQYDITVIMNGFIGGEYKKTSGHFHGFNPQRTNTYPEVYEVISGKALYILQKQDNFERGFETTSPSEVIFALVEAGQSIIIPPNYGHCSINIGIGPMIFSNLAYKPCPVFYDSVKYYHGMSYYVLNDNGTLKAEKNAHYSFVPKMKYAHVQENESLGIKFCKPIYQSFKQDPDAFNYLRDPDLHNDEIMLMLNFIESI